MASAFQALFRVAVVVLVAIVLLDVVESKPPKKTKNSRRGDPCRRCYCNCESVEVSGRGFWRWWFFRQRAKCKLCRGNRKILCCPSTTSTATGPTTSSMTSSTNSATSTTPSGTTATGSTDAPTTSATVSTNAPTTSATVSTNAPTTPATVSTDASTTSATVSTDASTTSATISTDAPTTSVTTASPAVSCDADYGALSPTHTLCMATNGNFTETCSVDIQVILDEHNADRAGVNPTATNMQKMVWDADLAAIAQAWAEQCQIGHDSNTRDLIGVSPSPGQNGAFGYSDWAAAIAGWYGEVNDFQYGIPLADYGMTFGKIGHYTQLVQAEASRVGCGCAMCKDVLSAGSTLPHYFCNYFGPNFNIIEPYEDGTQCAACPTTCVGGLCDCNGKYCYNYGTLDLNTCTCSCRAAYTGDECLTVV